MSTYDYLQYVTENPYEVDWEEVAEENTGSGGSISVRETDDERYEITISSHFTGIQYGSLLENPYQVYNLNEFVKDNTLKSYSIEFDRIGMDSTISGLSTRFDDKLVTISGRVDHTTDTDAVVCETTYECNKCGSETTKNQNVVKQGIEEPSMCAVCEKSSFSELRDERERINRKTAILSEVKSNASDDCESIVVRLFGSMTGRLKAGKTVRITGVLKHIDDEKTGESHREIVVMDVDSADESVSVSEEEEQEFHKLAQSDEYEQKLIDSFAPHIVCRDKEKRGLLYSAVSGSGGVPEHMRDTSHLLMIGDPSTGKSELMKWLQEIMPNSVMATGSSSTGVGLTATVEKNEETGETVASAGALAQAHESVAFVDELDEFSEDSLGKLLSTLSDSQIQLNKYNINTTLPSKTVFVGSANPMYGEFSGHMNIKDEFDFPPELLARMDQIFVVEKDPDNAIQKAKAQAGLGNASDPPLSRSELKKLIWLARQKNVEYGQDTLQYGAELAGQLIQNSDAGDMRSSSAVHRLAVSSAKLHLRDEVTEEDVERAVELVAESLERIGQESVAYTGMTEDRIDAEQAVEEVLEVIYDDIDESPTRQNITERLVESKDMEPQTVQDAIDAKLEERDYFELNGEIQYQASD